MPDGERRAFGDSMFSAQMALGWCFPNAVMQYAIPDLENLSIDQAALTRRRNCLMSTLTESGYEVLPPEGTFYLWSRWPQGDPAQHWNHLADRNVFVLPGALLSAPDYFRVSLTASDEMVERALSPFREVGRLSRM
jgi:aspartate aminotransferase